MEWIKASSGAIEALIEKMAACFDIYAGAFSEKSSNQDPFKDCMKTTIVKFIMDNYTISSRV